MSGLDTLGGASVLFMMAALPEYGPALRQRIAPLITGVGPIEAALEAGMALQRHADAGTLPDLVVCMGSAGSRTLIQGDIYQASSVSWRDMDASALGFEKGRTPFCDHPVEVALPTPLASVPAARLSTGANVVTGHAYSRVDADMVDMESFAVLRACQRFAVPLLVIRGISDGATDLRRYEDWTALLGALDDRLARAVDSLEAALASGQFAPKSMSS